jgi:hypothetical protein
MRPGPLHRRAKRRRSSNENGDGAEDARHRPVVWSGSRARRSFFVLESRRDVRNDWAFHRARGATCLRHMAATCFSGTWLRVPLEEHTTMAAFEGSRPQKQENACVPHATVLSACDSQRHHAPGALTECLASPHCWVLGPPTSSADRRSFLDLAGLLQPANSHQKARSRDGAVASRATPATKPALHSSERDTREIFLSGGEVNF